MHHAADPRSRSPAVALERTILADVHSRIAHHDIAGPAGKVSCDLLPSLHTGRLAFRCYALAGGFS